MIGILNSDGGCRPTNPGPAGFAAVLELVDEEEVYVTSRYLGKKSNNHAEYAGMLVGIKMAISHGVTDLLIITDSQLVMNQVNGDWKVKDTSLRPFCSEIQKLLRVNFEHNGSGWKIKWVKRDKNKTADAYCTQAIFWGMNQRPWEPSKEKKKRGPGAVYENHKL